MERRTFERWSQNPAHQVWKFSNSLWKCFDLRGVWDSKGIAAAKLCFATIDINLQRAPLLGQRRTNLNHGETQAFNGCLPLQGVQDHFTMRGLDKASAARPLEGLVDEQPQQVMWFEF